jgi:hypothetical protein
MLVPLPNIERAPLLRVFGSLATRVAGFLRRRPELAQRLVFAPPEAIHAISAYLYHGLPPDLSDDDVAGMVETHHPRELLLKAFPDLPRSFYRALRGSGERACEPEIYVRAANLATGQFSAAFLNGDPLSSNRQAHYEALTSADPFVAKLHHTLPIDPSIVDAASNVFRLLRAHNALPDDINVPASAGSRAALRCVLRLIDNLKVPALPFALPAPYVQIGTVGELRRTGRAYKNCLRDRWHGPRFWIDAAAGQDAFILCKGPRFVVRLNRLAEGHYRICEFAGPANSVIDRAVRDALLDTLGEAGANIYNYDPALSITRLLDSLGHVRGSAGADPDFGSDYLAV